MRWSGWCFDVLLKIERYDAKPLPKYDNPPVEEVVFGVTFEPLHQFKTPCTQTPAVTVTSLPSER
jgi:hypothetical protein